MEKLTDPVLPLTSVVLNVTTVVPTEKVSPEECELLVELIPQLSTALGPDQTTTALQEPASTDWVMLPGTLLKVGFSSSVTETRKLLAERFPEASIAE